MRQALFTPPPAHTLIETKQVDLSCGTSEAVQAQQGSNMPKKRTHDSQRRMNHKTAVGSAVGNSGLTHLAVFVEACLWAVWGSGDVCVWPGEWMEAD